MNKEGWLKVGVVGVPICAYIMLVHLPTTSPYGYSSFPKEESLVTFDTPTFSMRKNSIAGRQGNGG